MNTEQSFQSTCRERFVISECYTIPSAWFSTRSRHFAMLRMLRVSEKQNTLMRAPHCAALAGFGREADPKRSTLGPAGEPETDAEATPLLDLVLREGDVGGPGSICKRVVFWTEMLNISLFNYLPIEKSLT